VQGYVFAAKTQAARLAHCIGEYDLEIKLRGEAQILRKNFEAAFWCEDLGTYALALDGDKNPCRVRTSNAGHALFTGIAAPERAARVAGTLLGRDSFSGWGIRTVASGEARFNPISITTARSGRHDNDDRAWSCPLWLSWHAVKVFSAMLRRRRTRSCAACLELFCGFIRKPHRGPTAYPVACAPQAWASAAPLRFSGPVSAWTSVMKPIRCHSAIPPCPPFGYVTLNQLSLGKSRLDLRLHRHGRDVTLNLLRRQGDAKVMLVK
jgi:glycogen debranching enzyme